MLRGLADPFRSVASTSQSSAGPMPQRACGAKIP
jgi:hypothetical protein